MAERGFLSGRTALVTGGGTGIGLGCARQLVRAGATVTMLEKAVEDLENDAAAGAAVRWARCDVTQEADVASAVKAACGLQDRLDITVANAGSGALGPILSLTPDEWRYAMDLNVLGTALTIKHAGLAMKESGGGSIIAISSPEAQRTARFLAPYSVSKAGLEMLVRCAAVELGEFEIRVNAIQSGFVRTDGTRLIVDTGMAERIIARTPLRRSGSAEEIGDTVCYLARPQSSWITGQVFAVDGGLSVPTGEDFEPMARHVFGDDAIDPFTKPRQ
jgi:NAD(P)-dependent dehydrogenase (short-subunit alcohol dehydrogenase family)